MKAALAAVATLALAGCAPSVTVGASMAADIQPAAYATYSWEPQDEFPVGDPRLDKNPIFLEQVRKAVDAELLNVGLRRRTAPADLTVHFHATVRDRVNVWESDRAAGYDVSGYPATQVQQYEEGTILVDLAEAKTKKLIWRGWVQMDVTGAIGNDAELDRRVKEGMAKLFRKFPATCVIK